MIGQSRACASFTSREVQTLEPIWSLYHKGFDIHIEALALNTKHLSKKHLLLKMFKTLLRNVLLHDPLGVHPIYIEFHRMGHLKMFFPKLTR